MAETSVRFTNLEKELWPKSGVSKGELVAYLDAVRHAVLPHLRERPLSVIRFHGEDDRGFFQKDLPKYAPDWVKSVRMYAPSAKRHVRYPLCNDRRTLLWFANQRAVELHAALARRDKPDRPTDLVLDIDPPAGAFDRAAEVARLLRAVLADLGLAARLKTSGGKGLHVIVPLRRTHTFDDVRAASLAVAHRAEQRAPDLVTTEISKKKRGGRVLIDWTRSQPAQTLIAPLSPRGRPGLPVSFPVAWDELSSVDPRDFTIATVPRIVGDGDPWTELSPPPQSLPRTLTA
ncbi:MAG TPA: non-homologous end-joining DNA ligase [Actinomycetota bacterium]|nr:non-homologous end-joining DNA ligase [Actinomycetota bacterium]